MSGLSRFSPTNSPSGVFYGADAFILNDTLGTPDQDDIDLSEALALCGRAYIFSLTGNLTAENPSTGYFSTLDLSALAPQTVLSQIPNPPWTDAFGEAFLNWPDALWVSTYDMGSLGSDGNWTVELSALLGNAGTPFTDGTKFWNGSLAVDITNSVVGSHIYSSAFKQSMTDADSGVTFAILPIGSSDGITTQKLWGPSTGGYSGTCTVIGVSFFEYNGSFDASTGVPT